MGRLVDWVAPRTWAGGVGKGIVFLVLVNLVDWAVLAAAGGGDYDGLVTTLVALPFVALVMAVLAHQRGLQRRLSVMATTDLLTGLPNRRAFLARATALDGAPGALLVLDADHFKVINDTWGHAAGDACLAAIARHLRASLRAGDLVGRLGGEEFSAFLPGATRAEAEAVGDRLCRELSVQAEGLGEALRVSLSGGAALGERGLPFERLLARADRALYRAKALGRARLVWAEEGAPAA